MDTSSSS